MTSRTDASRCVPGPASATVPGEVAPVLHVQPPLEQGARLIARLRLSVRRHRRARHQNGDYARKVR